VDADGWARDHVAFGCRLDLVQEMFGPLSWLNPGGLRAPPLLTQILLDQIEEAQLGLAFHWEEKVYQVEYGTGQLSVSPSDLRRFAKIICPFDTPACYDGWV
jgi:hypothetical protein